MSLKICKNLQKFSLLKVTFGIIAASLLLLQNSFAQQNSQSSDNSGLIQEIERSLLFDKEAMSRVEVYKKNSSVKKSDVVINAANKKGDKNSAEEKKEIEIVVVDTKSENFDLREKEKLAYNAALIGQHEVAVELYKQVLALEKDNDYAKFSLAVVYQKLGQNKQAKALYRELLTKNPENREEIIGNLLVILIEESPNESTYLLSRLLIQNPDSHYIFAQAALAYDKTNKTQDAVNLMKRAVELDPQNVGYLYNYAVILDKANMYEDAVSAYNSLPTNYAALAEIGVDQKDIESRINNLNAKIK